MHEYHMAERIVTQAVDAAGKNGASRITGITVVIARKAAVSPESIRLHFAQAAAGTIAESAELTVKEDKDGAAQDLPGGFYLEDIEVSA